MSSCFSANAVEYNANFRDMDIREFIDIVSKNLNKTFIVDPRIQGLISARSYNSLNAEQYYQFFLSVLDIYGYAVVPMDNGLLKVIHAADAKISGAPLVDSNHMAQGDEVISRVLALQNVPVRDLAPVLRQFSDSASSANIAPYEPANTLLMTGRASVINRLVDLVMRVDNDGKQSQDIIQLHNASASSLADVLKNLNQLGGGQPGSYDPVLTAKVVADNRTNSLVISGTLSARQRMRQLIDRLDSDSAGLANTRVIYLKYAKAENLVGVLTGAGQRIQGNNSSKSTTGFGNSGQNTLISTSSGQDAQLAASSPLLPGRSNSDVNIVSDEDTNSLVITAPPGEMSSLERIVSQLDVARAQVLVEAIIVEVQDGDGLNLGIQWSNKNAGGQQFIGSGVPIFPTAGSFSTLKQTGTVPANSALGLANGLTMGFFRGDWGALLSALASNSKNDILSTPSIVTLNNKEASMNVGQDVPVLSGSQTTTGDNVFNTVERKTVGTKLKVTPQINEGDSIYLNIEQEVSSIDNTAPSSSLGPTFNTRTIQNTVQVRSGETVVLGGLIDNSTQESVSKVPLLGDIPIVGNLFRYKSVNNSKRNLMVFIRPIIIRNDSAYTAVSRTRYQNFAEQQGQAGDVPQNTRLPGLNDATPAALPPNSPPPFQR